MIDLSNKSFQTRDDTESEKLLRIAVAQGYSLPKGLKALVGARYFKFVGFPYKSVAFPETANEKDLVMFADVFGDENEELKDILKRTGQFCKAHGYNMIRIYADEGETEYSVSGFAKIFDGGTLKTAVTLKKPMKVTMDEIEKRFGCPVEIVP